MQRRHSMAGLRTLVAIVGLAAASLGVAACGWKTGQDPSAVPRETYVVMQDQHGQILGSRVFPRSSRTITLTVADAGAVSGLSSKYIAIRREPLDGTIGELVVGTNTGSVSFTQPNDGAGIRAVFMSTADLPERVMDCFYGQFRGPGFKEVGRAVPGLPIAGLESARVVDGDESIFKDAINVVNRASTDSRGVALARLSWDPGGTNLSIMTGFSEPALLTYGDWWYGVWYVLVNPRSSRSTQTTTALRGLLCDSCESAPCGADFASYFVDPAANYQLSPQGVSLVRFGAQFGTAESMWWWW